MTIRIDKKNIPDSFKPTKEHFPASNIRGTKKNLCILLLWPGPLLYFIFGKDKGGNSVGICCLCKSENDKVTIAIKRKNGNTNGLKNNLFKKHLPEYKILFPNDDAKCAKKALSREDKASWTIS